MEASIVFIKNAVLELKQISLYFIFKEKENDQLKRIKFKH